jgi:hypothetical protein
MLENNVVNNAKNVRAGFAACGIILFSPERVLASSVVEPEPELELQGARSFGRSRSWSRYTEVSAPGQTKVVYLITIRIE